MKRIKRNIYSEDLKINLKSGKESELLRSAKSQNDLKKKFQGFKGIGPMTTRIFLRDLKKYGLII